VPDLFYYAVHLQLEALSNQCGRQNKLHRKCDSFYAGKYQSHLSLHELSAHYNYSPSRFSSLFKQKTGYAPIDYFIQMKMQKATQLLDFTNKPIKDIASIFGFDDPYYFSRRFKKIIGMSPKKYRSINKA
jgi:AraC-like DNA-binding protein